MPLRFLSTDVVRQFASNTKANVAAMFAISLVGFALAVGGGVDLARSYNASQKLYEVAVLGCQYASRPSVIDADATNNSGTGGGSTYSTMVTNFINSSLTSQNFQYTQTNATPFTFTQNGPANVSLTAVVPTTFMQIANITQMPVSATVHCYDSPSSIPQVNTSSSIVSEGFENVTCNGPTCYILPDGSSTSWPQPRSPVTFTANVGYTGTTGTQWYISGYCLEIDRVGQIKSSTPQGTHEAELDCDNGSNSAGNSAISTKVYLAAGDYELRWDYASRIEYPDYDPTYICGTTASDVSWANDTNAVGGGNSGNSFRNNQINVYLDAISGSSPPTHTTFFGETLAGSNLIDVCVYGMTWLERSVRIVVTTPQYYWLTFAADGQNNSYGGQIDNIRLCPGTCPGTPQDNFPSSWLSSKVLFEDTFETPFYTVSGYNTAGNMYNSTGTSGSASGWPTLAASGWANAPVNQIPYWAGCPQGIQCVQLGWNTSSNTLISRPFLLDPGYYEVDYNYVPEVKFSNLTSVYCGATPSAANISSLSSQSGTGVDRVLGVSHGTLKEDTNTVGVFMSHAQLASTPNLTSTLGATTTYTNPSGTTTTTPTAAPNAISLTSYNSAQNNPLLDICGYAPTAQARSATILIQKPAYYWLTLSSLGTIDDFGGQIDDVKLTALGSPYMSSPPSGAVTIPVPAPQALGSIAYSGFYVPADPLTAPAPEQ
jgi:hypothetical protein